MVEIVPFKKEHASDEGLKKEMMLRFFYPSENYLQMIEDSGMAFTGIENGKVLGCAGIIKMWNGVGEAWSFLTPDAKANPPMLHRAVSHGLRNIIDKCNFHRIQMLVDPTFDEGHRWAQKLGFFVEGARLQYGSDKKTYIMYVLLRDK